MCSQLLFSNRVVFRRASFRDSLPALTRHLDYCRMPIFWGRSSGTFVMASAEVGFGRYRLRCDSVPEHARDLHTLVRAAAGTET